MLKSIQQLLKHASAQLTPTSETALLDAEVLLCHCLGKNRSFLRTWPEKQLEISQQKHFASLVAQRQNGIPIAYLTGHREFWSRTFQVNPDVLIPRPDSELLIELSLELLPSNRPCKILDLGTGSGILAITLAAERPQAQVLAIDISQQAITTAKHNADQLNISNTRFMVSHWLDKVVERDFDLIISNPPYIAENDPHLQQGDLRFEPTHALVSTENGLKDIRLLSAQATRHLKPKGYLLVEHGYNQTHEVQALFAAAQLDNINTFNDLSGQPRVTSGIWNQS
ncbi:peptide chain release factor N(5)-glutamine methyltransferase [Methylomonas sp. AM2-LC]|uniref:peptide chain release factor N(5)-glutamine methyltransferase n=1 Tax=Methylomonas sp. AM2-LC TaxID=3153301 RepID=UPI00326791CA